MSSNYWGRIGVTERGINLKDQQEQLQNTLFDVERQLALNALQQIVDKVATAEGEIIPTDTSPELVRKIGRAVQKSVRLLELLAPTTDTKTEIVADAEVETEIVPEATSSEPVVEEDLPTPEVFLGSSENPPYDITRSGEKYIEAVFGKGWKTELNVDDQTTAQSIAEKIVTLTPPRKPNTPEKMAARIVGRLHGLSAKDIAEQLHDTVAATSQSYITLKSRIAELKAKDRGESTVPAQVITPSEIVETVPTIHTEIILDNEEDSEETQEAEPRETVEALLTRHFNLSGVDRVALASYLNLKMRSDMTPAKVKLAEQLRPEVRAWFDHPTYKLDTDTAKVLRRAFGVYVMQGSPVDRAVFSLQGAFSEVTKAKYVPEFAQSIDDALYAIFNDAPKEETVPVVKEAGLITEETKQEVTEPSYRRVFELLRDSGTLDTEDYVELSKWFSLADKGAVNDELTSQLLLQLTPKIRRQIIDNGGVKSGDERIDSHTRQYVTAKNTALHQYAARVVENGDAPSIDHVRELVLSGIEALYKAA
jgi:hypothetical protein